MHSISRRGLVFSAATTAAVFGIKGPLAIVGEAAAQGSGSGASAGAGFLKYAVGSIEAFSVHDGHNEFSFTEGFARNAKLEDVKAAVKAAQGSDEKIRIPFTMTAIRNGDRITLIDTGTGAQMAPTAGQYMDNLKAAGIDHTKVSAVLISHFHGDHIFGLMAKDTNAQVFPNAQILLPEAEFKWWTDSSVFTKLPEARHGLAKRIQATFPTWKNVKPVATSAKEIYPGIQQVNTNGHTPGHTSYLLASGKKQLMVLGDVANVPALFVKNPGWHAVFDQDAALAEKNRRAVFDRVVADKITVTGYHFGLPGAGTIAKDGKGYVFTPIA